LSVIGLGLLAKGLLWFFAGVLAQRSIDFSDIEEQRMATRPQAGNALLPRPASNGFDADAVSLSKFECRCNLLIHGNSLEIKVSSIVPIRLSFNVLTEVWMVASAAICARRFDHLRRWVNIKEHYNAWSEKARSDI
jgi:hypothetical protein